jgi:hypothetical protein
MHESLPSKFLVPAVRVKVMDIAFSGACDGYSRVGLQRYEISSNIYHHCLNSLMALLRTPSACLLPTAILHLPTGERQRVCGAALSPDCSCTTTDVDTNECCEARELPPLPPARPPSMNPLPISMQCGSITCLRHHISCLWLPVPFLQHDWPGPRLLIYHMLESALQTLAAGQSRCLAAHRELGAP